MVSYNTNLLHLYITNQTSLKVLGPIVTLVDLIRNCDFGADLIQSHKMQFDWLSFKATFKNKLSELEFM